MEEHFATLFDRNVEYARDYIYRHGGIKKATDFVLKSSEINWKKFPGGKKTFIRETYRTQLHQFGLDIPAKMEDASEFELRIFCEVSPFYAMVAYSVSYTECLKAARSLSLQISEEQLAYFLIYDYLQNSSSLSIDECKKILHSNNIKHAFATGIHQIYPFGKGIMYGHPLEHVNIADTPEATLMRAVNGNIVDLIREAESVKNRIMLYDGYYYMENTFERLAYLLADIITDNY